MDVQILYKDQHLLLVRKPAGVPAQPDPSGQQDLLTELQLSHPSVSLIHRLDTPTGGLMVYGLTPKTTTQLCALIQDHNVFCKEYLVVLSAPPPNAQGRLTDYLFHDRQKNKGFVTDGKRKGSKIAVLDYKVLETCPDGHTLVSVRLHTGRTHQIRIQFASRGLPLVGDGKYGSREKAPFIGLWAYRLSFPHPITGKSLSAEVLPDSAVFPWSLFPQIHINE